MRPSASRGHGLPRDLQLERGVAEVMKRMAEKPMKLPARPEDPVKTKQDQGGAGGVHSAPLRRDPVRGRRTDDPARHGEGGRAAPAR